jgi:ankyrin repeat protein
MPRERAAKPVTTTMVPHRSPQLAQLLEAAKTCEIEPVRRFLAAGELPDTLVEVKLADGTSVMSPLVLRAIAAHRIGQDPAMRHASLELLLQAAANANSICTVKGRQVTALMAACTAVADCCTAPVRLLLGHGADPALQTSSGEIALHDAARAGGVEVCKMLLEDEGCDAHARDCNGITPLVCAVYTGHVQVVELLHREWGADLLVRMTQSDGETLLHLAAAAGQRLMLEYLLHNGLDVNAATRRAVTPVCVAAEAGNTEAVQTLLEHGASTLAVNYRGDSVLMVAVELGQTSVVEMLLTRGGMHSNQTVDVNATIADGSTALHTAACKDRIEAAALMLQHGADADKPTDLGITPLLVAASCSSAEFVRLLLDAGADVTAQYPAGATVLHAAAENSKHPGVLQLLLEQNSASALLDNLAAVCECCGPRTAIMICGQPAHLKLLLAAGADVHKATDTGNTALHVAAVHKFAAPVMCLLIKAGVDLHAMNSDGKTAAQVAADSSNTLAAALLMRAARET